ncbi:MAG: hypothetical protein CVU39_21875 [Chloroflexi bacterium HGW-Chloroflexi-10]|nr:MAG: hypothetical protein CVU39_21875 [Chloroflexi bacterium HGW-Chloroflexi-10]
MLYAVCPACGEDIPFNEHTQVGQNMVCPRCRELLAVVITEPPILELYKIASNNELPSDDKLEAARRHDRKSKHYHDEFEEEVGLDWKRTNKKSKSRGRYDW